MKVKIIGSTKFQKLEERINNFISDNKDIKIVDIKFNDNEYCSVLIMYFE